MAVGPNTGYLLGPVCLWRLVLPTLKILVLNCDQLKYFCNFLVMYDLPLAGNPTQTITNFNDSADAMSGDSDDKLDIDESEVDEVEVEECDEDDGWVEL